MYRIVVALAMRLRELRTPRQLDRGETGPLGYAVLVSAIVVLAILVAGWGEDIARTFMQDVEVEGVEVPEPGE